ncbi:hypothetical protein NEUTE1DRAFT_92273 [Neurospora tetrasperma FGSC 2508]|uniref:C2H2-type domain-containing protein n=1 Tax=Neurospora tetrasperma (strain FGSC 2508 / ATCC MYA-4615 / P0657) TaxID=510951 RepID=F8N1R0_NEUT8|nr:uncharacterized protein NEUTE1DRAFT_92273 [Neurospora tetrasperma FGSC 2508]EGO53186.1 hypothetical protein NEUTE1DRAFT_92273 [Neurospora tetrasperma FGSC 2508]
MSTLQHQLSHDGGLYSAIKRSNASNVTLSQASMPRNHLSLCPHEEKVVTDGIIAPMVLQEVNVERKRSLDSKMRDTFTFRKRDNNYRANALSKIATNQPGYMLHTRTHTAASTESVVQGFAMIGCPAPHSTMPYLGHTAPGDSFSLHKLPTTTDMMDASLELFRQGFNAEEMSELQSVVSSIAASSTTEVEASQRASTNTSRTNLFPPNVSHNQSPTPPIQGNSNTITSKPYLFTSKQTIPTGALRLDGLPPPAAMTLDDLVIANSVPVSQTSMSPALQVDNHSWWSPTLTGGIQESTADLSGTCSSYHAQMPPALSTIVRTRDTEEPQIHQHYYEPGPGTHQAMTRSPSLDLVEAMQPENQLTGTRTFQRQHSHPDRTTGIAIHYCRPNNSTQQELSQGQNLCSGSNENDLICDECQWKPRGVRGNLKGYLRKHKNTHKGLRLSCHVPGCTKTFSRLDNLKKHKKDKHGIDDTAMGGGGTLRGVGIGGGGLLPWKRVASTEAEEQGRRTNGNSAKRPDTSDSQQRLRDLSGDYPMLWPALHF